ncbi:hypothetical protein Tco_0319046 [Tanacetum coccineum]
MPYHPIYRGDRVTESPHVYNRWKPKAPWDIPMKSRNVEMFALTYELSYYHMHPDTYARFYFSVLEGFINHLRKIDNLVSEAFGVLSEAFNLKLVLVFIHPVQPSLLHFIEFQSASNPESL